MKNLENSLLKLMKEYIACSKYMCGLIHETYNTNGETLLSARRINLIPQTGEIEGGVEFNFHGGGCYFEFDSGTIDIDFGPEGRCDGFDQYRLYDFLKTSNIRSMQYPELVEEADFRNVFESLERNHAIVCPGWYPNPGLYYLKESV